MNLEKIDILSLTYPKLTKEVQTLGEPAFRGEQIFSWLHEKNVTSFQDMTNLSLALRNTLEKSYTISTLNIHEKIISKVDGTIKYLLTLPDGNIIETVLMHYQHGTSLCISTQVGCRMGCNFCASTLGGRVRNLTTAEILGQVYAASSDTGQRIDNIVLMGIGEPLDNLENVLFFLKIISDEKGKNLSLRSITLSTCGMVPQIYQLAEEKLPITLSISLHAVTDQERSEIMPINRKWNIASLLKAAKDYANITGRRVTYEYSLIEGVNDSAQHARKLAVLLKDQNAHVNLIPINPIAQRDYERGTKASVQAFQKELTAQKINATIRRELGSDIRAACGQLRHNNLHENVL